MQNSYDPRIQRLELDNQETPILNTLDHWQTFEVFHQAKRGDHHVHVGSVHASDAEMALILGKEQYARRQECVNIWVVKSADIVSLPTMDSDMFDTIPEKLHREASAYVVRDKIEAYNKTL